MPRTHVIQPGDWLGALAERYGVVHGARIWADPGNAALREARRSPDLLMVGDEVVIPDGDAPEHVEVEAGRRAVFVVRSRRDVLRVRVIGVAEFIEALGPIDYELRTSEESTRGQITEDGQIVELPLSPAVTAAELVLMRNTRFELAIGGLGPAGERRGAFDRLEMLGYVAEIVPGEADEADGDQQVGDPLAEALRSFQAAHDLTPSGELDAATQRALADEYGA